MILRDPGPGVSHRYRCPDRALHFLALKPDFDPAILGELDRIAHEVRHDLTDPRAVAQIIARHLRVGVETDVDSLFPRERFESLDHPPYHRFEVDPPGIERDRASLDPGDVERIVDQPQKVQNAENAVQRGPHLVAHHRQEL